MVGLLVAARRMRLVNMVIYWDNYSRAGFDGRRLKLLIPLIPDFEVAVEVPRIGIGARTYCALVCFETR